MRNLNLSFAYDSDKDDILNNFYIPALAISSSYKRIAGYFSSSAFALAARGLSKFIINGGHMQLIINHVMQVKDKNVLEQVIRSPSKLENILLQQMNSWDLENQIIRDHVGALGWMLANNLLELKIAISNETSVFHQKVGILEDVENNKISFSGSNNESSSGWKNNIEEFKVFRDWVSEQNKYVGADVTKFSSFWNNSSKRVVVLDLPNAIRKKIIEIAPKQMEDIHIDSELINQNLISTPGEHALLERKIELMDFQKKAVKSWVKNSYKGILEMATGTGKTLTALGCL
ncbi:MAG: DEAD/DEAH box helicase family protein, partial [Nanoarchaeota archaeon]|nr:DEAD/DEAH box helicase family protein [Nanoarchaeota archaeon]